MDLNSVDAGGPSASSSIAAWNPKPLTLIPHLSLTYHADAPLLTDSVDNRMLLKMPQLTSGLNGAMQIPLGHDWGDSPDGKLPRQPNLSGLGDGWVIALSEE